MKSNKLSNSIRYLEKKFGKGVVMDLQSLPVHRPSISVGHPGVDWVLGCGGFPFGMHVELYGFESSGKSTLSIHTAVACQLLKYNTGRVLYLDFENSFDLTYAKRLGLKTDKDHLLVSQPDFAEQGLEIMREFIDNELVDLIIVDSVAAMMPKAESAAWQKDAETHRGGQSGEMGKTTIGLQSRVVSQGLKQLSGRISSKKVCVIWINQIRTKISTSGGRTTTTTPGGNALKFYSSIRLELQKKSSLKGKLFDPWQNRVVDGVVGMITNIRAVKNKAAPPFREAPLLVRFGTGIDKEWTILEYVTKNGFLKKGGTGWYFTEGIGASRNARGLEDFRKLMKEEPHVWKKLCDQCDFDKLNQASLKVISVDGDSEESEPNPELDNLLGKTKQSKQFDKSDDNSEVSPPPQVKPTFAGKDAVQEAVFSKVIDEKFEEKAMSVVEGSEDVSSNP